MDMSARDRVRSIKAAVVDRVSAWWTRRPLRVRLVAVVVALVSVTLILTGVGSVVAMRDYLIGRVDSQLLVALAEIRVRSAQPELQGGTQFAPSDYLVAYRARGFIRPYYYEPLYGERDLPVLEEAMRVGQARPREPFTVPAANHERSWRIVVDVLPNGLVVAVGEDLSGVNNAVGRLILINLFMGLSVLIALAVVGVWVVRASLRPLVQIEQTAVAIARGDLTRRVPELDPNTELGELSAALNTMLTQIETAFRERAASEARAVRSEERMRQFVADASHELRTPLTTIRGFAELYRQGAAPDPGEVLRRIEDEAARMGVLVEDLLLLARLDQERPLNVARVALADLIRDAAASAHAVAPDRPIEVDIADPADSLVIDGDEFRLRQVIGNLVTNALTHTPAGTPVRLALRPDGEHHVVIEVSDRGPGLTPEQAERVFERFYRVDKARTRRAPTLSNAHGLAAPHSGAGLGLAIVAALVAAHNGTVEVDSTPGQGATFRVRLPLASSP